MKPIDISIDPSRLHTCTIIFMTIVLQVTVIDQTIIITINFSIMFIILLIHFGIMQCMYIHVHVATQVGVHIVCQYPLGAPSISMTFRITFHKCLTYRLHTLGVIAFQNSLMPMRSS